MEETVTDCVQQTSNEPKQEFLLFTVKRKKKSNVIPDIFPSCSFNSSPSVFPSSPNLLENAFNAPIPELRKQSFTQLSLGQLSRNGEISRSRERSSWIEPHLVGRLYLQDDCSRRTVCFLFKWNCGTLHSYSTFHKEGDKVG
ncbi:hypothetical protein ATANTOWER_022592 [Ataeniobius toweri]|uniref:Uncharacterized protein n=1 Tax=Ataeniobius toweri TaxID=208326 RepID=A0ABU7B395_9TELE|nr:hypothetical protein [Ataeniobius toweri]